MEQLQDSLDSSWHDESETLTQHLSTTNTQSAVSSDVHSLALDLSSQAEYNNELLEYIQLLEGRYSKSQMEQNELELRLRSAEKQAADSHEQAEELRHKVLSSSALYEELTSQQATTAQQATAAASESQELRLRVDELQQQKDMLLRSKDEASERVVQLESELAELRRKRLISDDSSADSIATLTMTLEKTTAELERERSLHYDLQLSSSLLKDENIQMTRRLEHFVKAGQEEQEDRESGARRLKDATATIAALKEQTSSLSAERDQLDQALTVSRSRLSESEAARWEAVESAQQTDLMWREIEEVNKQLRQAKQELEQRFALSEEKGHALERRLASCADKEREVERLLKDEHDRKTDAMRTKLEDLQQQLTRSSRRLEEVNDRNDTAQAASSERIEELNTLLQDTNNQLLASADALKKQKADESSRVLQLEKIIHDLRQQLRTAVHEERDAMKGKVQELILAREQLSVRGQRYSATVAGLHDAVHAISEEAQDLREQLVYLHRQQEKLLLVLRQMAPWQQEGVAQDGASGSVPAQSGHPVLGPLHEYCVEMQSALAGVIQKVVQSRELHQQAKKEGESRFAEVQQLAFEKEELRGQLSLAEESLAIARSKITRLEGQCEEASSEARRAQEASVAEREKLTQRLDKSENRVSDMIRQNTSVQADLRRVQAEHTAATREAEARYNALSNKLVKIAGERDEAREKEKLADTRHSDLQNQLMQSDARIAKQQADYRKLKKISLSLKEDCTHLTKSSQQQLTSLNQALEQYRVQLQHKQQLIGALQEQRAELTAGNERLHSLVAELREEREAAGAGAGGSTHRSGQTWSSSRQHLLSASSVLQRHTSSSSASSSRQALSGLAQLVHSSGGRGPAEGRAAPAVPLSVVHGTDIGSGVFNANLRHLSASLTEVDRDSPFKVPAMGSGGKQARQGSGNDENIPGNSSGDASELPDRFQLPEYRPSASSGPSQQQRHSGRERVDSFEGYDSDGDGGGERDIFRLTSPSKR